MGFRRVLGSCLLATVVLAGCAQPRSPASSPANGEPRTTGGDPGRTLSVIMRVEPLTMLEGSVDRSAIHKPLFAATLGAWSLQETPFPILAETLPQLNTDTWKVFPDGRMETTYRLRPGLAWHDGTPLTADDVAFTRRVNVARFEWGLDQGVAEFREMDEILAPDPRTVVIRWRQPYTEAAAPDLMPYPRHILEGPLDQGNAEAFDGHPYWSNGWIGAGPYKVDRWERGSFIEGIAFDGFALGAPKIKRVRLSWNNDPNVTLTRLLAGDGDIALDGSMRFQQASVLRERWTSPNDGSIMLNPTSLRYMQYQSRAEYVNPKFMHDLRVRRALMHALDRANLAETMLEDQSMVADTVPPRTAPYYQQIDRVITKYPFDPRRAEQLLGEVGFTKGGDGIYTSPTLGRFSLEVRGVSGGAEEQDTTIVADALHNFGLDTSIQLLPSSRRASDDMVKATFPGLTLNNNTLQRGLGLEKWHSANIGHPGNNWTGTNRTGFTDPEYNRLHELWSTTLDRNQANAYLADMMKLLSESVGLFPLYYNFQVVAHTAALRGPQPMTPDSTRYGNVHEWEWP
jgi:peptide/nickel transport system substrate-binding protein